MRWTSSSILDELINRWLIKVATLVAVYVTFRGHNAPGGGFAGGLILGAAFVLQFLSGREPTIRGLPIRRPHVLLGLGLIVALTTTIAPTVAGSAPLESHIWKISVPLIGDVKFVSSTFFDLGVFFVVVAVVLVILQALGTEGSDIPWNVDGEGS